MFIIVHVLTWLVAVMMSIPRLHVFGGRFAIIEILHGVTEVAAIHFVGYTPNLHEHNTQTSVLRQNVKL